MPVFRYGTDSSVQLEFADEVHPDLCGTPRGTPLTDLTASITATLDEPLDYPSLGRSTTPGDRVVLVLERGLPRAAQVTAAVVHSLVAAGVEPDGISVLRCEADVQAGAEDPCRLIRGLFQDRVKLATHDPANRGGLAYLAASEAGEPLMLNRLLTDADLVLPIGSIQAEGMTGYFGVHSLLFPEFSDYRTQMRFRRLECSHGDARGRRGLAKEVQHVAWLLGVHFAIQFVPAAGDGVLHVLAGESNSVYRRSQELYRAAWTWSVARPASLVVAAIEGGRDQQTWENLGRALEMAGRLVDEGGAIAVCCDLAKRPGPAVQQMAGARSRDSVMRKICRESPSDATYAVQLANALERYRVYLLSRLDPSLVEELEMTPVGGPEELARLVRHHPSCILLANAPRAMVTVENE